MYDSLYMIPMGNDTWEDALLPSGPYVATRWRFGVCLNAGPPSGKSRLVTHGYTLSAPQLDFIFHRKHTMDYDTKIGDIFTR